MNEPYVLSRRERKKRDCKYAILRAARELMQSDGVGVPVEEIAAKASISYPTFFHYFPTKSDLFYAIYLEEIEDVREFIGIALNDERSARVRLERIFAMLIADFARYPYLDLYLAGEVSQRNAASGEDEQLSLILMEALKNGVETGEFRQDTDVKSTALLIAGILLSASFYHCGEEDCRRMLSILLAGLAA